MLAFLIGCWLGFCAGIVLAAALQMAGAGEERDDVRR